MVQVPWEWKKNRKVLPDAWKTAPNPTMHLKSGNEMNGNVNEIFQMFWKFWLK